MSGLGSIAAVRSLYAAGASPRDVTLAVLERIAASPDPAIWISVRERADLLAEAERVAGSERAAPLWGIPFGIKDNIDVAGLPTTAACAPFAYRPGADATVVARLRAAGAIAIGKTNLDQFATGLVGARSPYGAPRCVFGSEYVSGGSSSGSAVAVARGQVSFALGTDTAGSGRVPAAFNHVVGVKPTRGILSTIGVVPACRSLDCVSVFAASVAEADLVRRVAQGLDAADPYARALRSRTLPLDAPCVGVLAAADRDFAGDAASAALYERAVESAAALGFELRPVDFAPFREAAAALYGSALVGERLAALEDALARHGDAFDPTVRVLLERARPYSAADAYRAQQTLAGLARRALVAWDKADVLLLPTAPTIFRVDEVLADPIGRNARLGLYTNFVNLLDCCAVAVPAGFRPDGLPFGVSLVAPAHSDEDLAVLADRLHRALEPTSGSDRLPLPPGAPAGARARQPVEVAVVGAHLAGQPLNRELVDRGAVLVERTRTAPTYRLYALPDTVPRKPALAHDPAARGPGIEVEVWALSRDAFGDLVAAVAPPHAIGTVLLAGGRAVKGFLCEGYALGGATEITHLGGWRAYLATLPGR